MTKVISIALLLALFFFQATGYGYFIHSSYLFLFDTPQHLETMSKYFFETYNIYSFLIILFLIPTTFIFHPIIAHWTDKTQKIFTSHALCIGCGIFGYLILYIGRLTNIELALAAGFFLVSVFLSFYMLSYALICRLFKNKQRLICIASVQISVLLSMLFQVQNIYVAISFLLISLCLLHFIRKLTSIPPPTNVKKLPANISHQITRVFALRRFRVSIFLWVSMNFSALLAGQIILLAYKSSHQLSVSTSLTLSVLSYLAGVILVILLIALRIKRVSLIWFGYTLLSLACILACVIPANNLILTLIALSLGSGLLYPILLNEFSNCASIRNITMVIMLLSLSYMVIHGIEGVFFYITVKFNSLQILRTILTAITLLLIFQIWVFNRWLKPLYSW